MVKGLKVENNHLWKEGQTILCFSEEVWSNAGFLSIYSNADSQQNGNRSFIGDGWVEQSQKKPFGCVLASDTSSSNHLLPDEQFPSLTLRTFT